MNLVQVIFLAEMVFSEVCLLGTEVVGWSLQESVAFGLDIALGCQNKPVVADSAYVIF